MKKITVVFGVICCCLPLRPRVDAFSLAVPHHLTISHPLSSVRKPCNLLPLYAASDEKSSDFALVASISGYVAPEESEDLLQALRGVGYQTAILEGDEFEIDDDLLIYRYSYSKATGMLKLVSSPSASEDERCRSLDPPRWVPVVMGEENVLVANGWSFLDPDESEPNSSFDVDAANEEGLYIPKWGEEHHASDEGSDGSLGVLSPLGYSLVRMSSEQVIVKAQSLDSLSKSVLLKGATDPPNRKVTHNEYDFSGSSSQDDVEPGLFACAIGGLPIFISQDLSPTTASSGWLSFSRPISDDHVLLMTPEVDATDQRVEVLCAKSGCHLGHYFGKGEGFCINASSLNFIPKTQGGGDSRKGDGLVSYPESWRSLDIQEGTIASAKYLGSILRNGMKTETVVLGAGCFWHVEFALRRLPGVVSTEVGYAGGRTTSPSYEDVCKNDTGHAEAVRITIDPSTMNLRILLDCFLAMHDPTKVRAHGKHEAGTGQYRSCVFVTDEELKSTAMEALEECQTQLEKPLSTVVRNMDDDEGLSNNIEDWFWIAEERHQRHDERKLQSSNINTLTVSISDWLREYARRSQSVSGSSQTIQTFEVSNGEDDDGMARMMI